MWRSCKIKFIMYLKTLSIYKLANCLTSKYYRRSSKLIFDSIKGNAQILSGISQIKYIVQAICVKLVLSDPLVQSRANQINENSYVCTLRIYPSTMFSEIKKASCEFWNKIEQKYVLTDEFYNNLSSYNDTVMNFFKIYSPLNPRSEAIVYLITAN